MKLSTLLSTTAGKSVVTLGAVAAVGSVGVFSTMAGLQDSAAGPRVTPKGGTLHITASNSAVVAQDFSNMKPGDTRSADFSVTNEKSLRADVTGEVTWSSIPASCFSYKITEKGETASIADDILVGVLAKGGETGSSRTYTLSVTENECPTADGADAVAPEASLSIDFHATQDNNAANGRG